MHCPVCNSLMKIAEAEIPAHQSGGNIVDAEYQKVWYCPRCENVEPIINEEED